MKEREGGKKEGEDQSLAARESSVATNSFFQNLRGLSVLWNPHAKSISNVTRQRTDSSSVSPAPIAQAIFLIPKLGRSLGNPPKVGKRSVQRKAEVPTKACSCLLCPHLLSLPANPTCSCHTGP